jgi:hypothetical protein
MQVPPPHDPRFVPPPAGSYGQPAPRSPPNSSEAIAAIVLAASAWMCFPLGFVAVWLGWRARILAAETPETVGGGQLGLVAMIVGGALAGLQTLLWLGYAAIFAWLALMHSPP